jgi:hypothetical protein
MGRPAKNNADFFSHDTGMRNHRKVKAIRNKFSIIGYAIWCMLLEHLTGSDGNEFEDSDSELELMAGDFGVSATEIRDVVNYCISLELLFRENGFIYSESLNERLAPVYEKRGKAKEFSKKQLRVNGKFCINNTDGTGVSATEKPQSKVKESKVKESKLYIMPFELFWDKYAKKVGREKTENMWKRLKPEEHQAIMTHLDEYTKTEKRFRKDPERYLKNKTWKDEVVANDLLFEPNLPKFI